MSTVRLENVRKVFPVEEDESKKKKRLFKKEVEESYSDKVKPNLQITEEGVVALQNFSLEIKDKEFIVLVGPSGCGKSTTLRMIAGLEEMTDGNIYIDDVLVNNISPKDRDVAMVFQNYALYPHMTVYENMAFSLQMQKLPKDVIDRKVKEAAETLEITDLLERKPKALSGGQRQRVAIGRAIVRNPKVLLMDEPLSNLDAKLRNQMRAEIIKLRDKIDTTFIYVTHDQIEAMTLGDRIVVMKDGYIQQIDSPQNVYNYPANVFVAGFIGTPQMNFVRGRLKKTENSASLAVGDAEFDLTEYMNGFPENLASENEVTVGIRPSDVYVSDTGIEVSVDFFELMGSEYQIHAKLFGYDFVISSPANSHIGDLLHSKQKKLFISFDTSKLHIFDLETEKRIN